MRSEALALDIVKMIVDGVGRVGIEVICVELLRFDVTISFAFFLALLLFSFITVAFLLRLVMVLMMFFVLSVCPVQTFVGWWTAKVRDHEFDDRLVVQHIKLKLLVQLQEVCACLAVGRDFLLQSFGCMLKLCYRRHASPLDGSLLLSGRSYSFDGCDFR